MSENSLTDADLERIATLADRVVEKRLESYSTLTKSRDVRYAEELRASELLRNWLRTVDVGKRTLYRAHLRIGTMRQPYVEDGKPAPPDGALRENICLSGISIQSSHQVPFIASNEEGAWAALSDQRKFGNRVSLTPTRLALVVDACRRMAVYFGCTVRAPTTDSLGKRRPGTPKFWERSSVIVSIDRVKSRGIPPPPKGGTPDDGPHPLARWLRIVSEKDLKIEARELLGNDLTDSAQLQAICDAIPSLEEVLKKQGKTPLASDDEESLLDIIRRHLKEGKPVDVARILEERDAAAA